MGLIVLEIDTFHLDISDILKIPLANFHLLIKEIWVIKKTNMKNGFFLLTKDAVLVLGCGQLNCCRLSIVCNYANTCIHKQSGDLCTCNVYVCG